MNLDALTDKLPDVYFDWYARFLPGSIGVISYFFLSKATFVISGASLVLYAFVAYLAGHVIQPVVGFIIKKVENIISAESEQKYSNAKKNAVNDVLLKKVSKAHAEANSMLATALILTVLAVYFSNGSWQLSMSIIYFALMSVERIYARKRKIKDLP